MREHSRSGRGKTGELFAAWARLKHQVPPTIVAAPRQRSVGDVRTTRLNTGLDRADASVAAVCIYTLAASVEVRIYTHVTSADIISALKADGWAQVARKGSHVQFKHPTKPGRVTVPHPKKDIPIGTLRSIEKQAALKLR